MPTSFSGYVWCFMMCMESNMEGFVYFFRLGLGAKFVPHSNINATVTPIEKKLRAKLQTSKTNQDLIPCKAQKGMDKSSEANVEHDVSDGEEDSKSSCFSKKDTSKSSKAHLIQEFQNGRKKRKKG